jgi:hypothetical protein
MEAMENTMHTCSLDPQQMGSEPIGMVRDLPERQWDEENRNLMALFENGQETLEFGGCCTRRL